MAPHRKGNCILLVVLCCLTLLLAGCHSSADSEAELPAPSFKEGEPHSNAVAFRLWFEVMTSSAGPCTVSVQDAIYDEEQATEWWYAIQSDLNTLSQALSLPEDDYRPFTIFIVENALNGIQVWNDCLYCTPEDILSGAYRESLIHVSLTTEPWKQVGLSRSLFSTEPVDTEQVAVYLENAEDLDILSLFAAYFTEDFAAEEETSIAEEIAQLLCDHVITAHSGAMLVEEACIDCRQELLDELGVDRTYVAPYESFDLDYEYGSDSSCPLIVTTARGDVFYITPLPGDAETPAAVRELLYDAWKGPQVILEIVEAEAPEYAEPLAQNYSAPFTCYLEPQRTESGAGSVTYSLTREIHLGTKASIVHEIMHLIIPIERQIAEQWKYEAVATYFTYRVPNLLRMLYSAYFSEEDLQAGDYESEEGYLFDQKVIELYCSEAGYPQDIGEFDAGVFNKAVVLAAYLTENPLPSVSEAYQMTGISNTIKANGGNELSYWEAAVFSDYLIRTYSLSTYLNYCLDVDTTFEKAFGMDYETAKAAWLEELMPS